MPSSWMINICFRKKWHPILLKMHILISAILQLYGAYHLRINPSLRKD